MITAKPAKHRKGVYKYVVRERVLFKNTPIKMDFINPWLAMKVNGDITINGSYKDGYAWDGCTPKYNIIDLFLLGIPDGRNLVLTGKPVTYYASMIHDMLCQHQKEIGITRKQADQTFLMFMGDFKLRYLYYYTVRVYGIISRWLN